MIKRGKVKKALSLFVFDNNASRAYSFYSGVFYTIGTFMVFAIILSLLWVYSSGAMEIIHTQHNKKSDTAVDMHSFWSADYNKNIGDIKKLDLKESRLPLKTEYFLPSHADTLTHLLYFSTISKKNDGIKTLFTQKQQHTFDVALHIKRSVPWGFCINGGVIIGTALFPFINMAALAQCSNGTQSQCLSQVATIMTPTIPSVVGALVVGFISLYATGLSPDISSRKANKVQDEISYLSRKYATIAKYWIDIYFDSPDKARYIAEKFDIEELKKRAQLKTHKTKLGGSLISPLEEAYHFIKEQTVLITFTEIENYLYNKINYQRIEHLNKRIESLEKIIHQKDAEIEHLKQEKI